MKKLLLMLMAVVLFSGCEKPAPPRAQLQITGPEKFTCTILNRQFKGPKIRLALPPGTYMLYLQAPGYNPKFAQIKLKNREKYRYIAELEPLKGLVLLTSKPAMAEVFYQGRNLGLTPVVLKDLPLGSHEATFKRRGYAARTVTWRIENDRPLRVPVNLDFNYGTLELRSNPARSRVFIDGKEVGFTPYRVEREAGKYLIKVEHSGYIPQERSIVVRRAIQTAVNFNLTKRPGSLTVNSEPSGAEFFLNEVKKGVTPCQVGNLKPGKYQVKLTKPGYDPLLKTVEIAAGSQDQLNLQLLSSTGSVWFSVTPPGVTVTLDGKLLGKAQAFSPGSASTKPFNLNQLAAGIHKLELTHPRGNPPRKTISFEVKKGKHIRLDKVDMWVANCEIVYIDDSVERGALYQERPHEVTFGPEPGIRMRISRDKIKKLTILND